MWFKARDYSFPQAAGHTKKKAPGEEEEKKNGASGGMKNAVYCMDLDECAEDDVRYFFDVLLN